jgi:hypothetical protein
MKAILAVLLALDLVRVTAPDGLSVDLNPQKIISMRVPREDDARTSNSKVRCIIFTEDGKFVSTLEDCETIRGKIRELSSED